MDSDEQSVHSFAGQFPIVSQLLTPSTDKTIIQNTGTPVPLSTIQQAFSLLISALESVIDISLLDLAMDINTYRNIQIHSNNAIIYIPNYFGLQADLPASVTEV